MAGRPRGTSLRRFSAFEKKRLQSQTWADILLEITEGVVRQLEQPRPPPLLAAMRGEHAPPELDLPARDREKGGVFVGACAPAPADTVRIQMRADMEPHIGRRPTGPYQPPRPDATR